MVVLLSFVVDKDAHDDDHGPGAAQECDCVSKDEYRDPDEESSLHRVSHATMRSNQILDKSYIINKQV